MEATPAQVPAAVQRASTGERMSSTTVADGVVDRLVDWGVERVLGYAGAGVDPILAALRRRTGSERDGGQAHDLLREQHGDER